MNRSRIVRSLGATLALVFALALNAGPSSAAPTYHLAIADTVGINEGAATCDVAFANQFQSTLTRPFEIAVKTFGGANATQFSGTVTAIVGPAITYADCPFRTLDGSANGIGNGTIYNVTAPLVNGVATFSSLNGTEPGAYSITFEYEGMTTNTIPMELDVAGVGAVTSQIGPVKVLVNPLSSSPTTKVSLPATGVISVTGYARMTAANGSSEPTTVVLTRRQVTELRQAIAKLPQPPSSSGKPIICMEEDTVFTISVAPTRGGSADWVATAYLCPAPGLLSIKDATGPQQAAVPYCVLRSFITSIFPKSKVAGTRAAFKFCDYASYS
jgi:hypothetical protein